jgi:hypothetical protein
LVERLVSREELRDAFVAGSIAAVFSGAPSTLHAALTGGDVLEATRAVGKFVFPDEERTFPLVAAAVPVHTVLSLGWTLVMIKVLPPKRTFLAGALFGGAIALLDLGLIGRRSPAIRELPQLPQYADHLAFGAIVGAVLQRRRRGRVGK